jgi:hypothetical protein
VVSPAPNRLGWNRTQVTVRFTASDASGIASVSPRQTIRANGARTVIGTARDRAGNTARARVVVRLDASPPALTIISPAAESVIEDAPTHVKVRVTDAGGSSLDPSSLALVVDGRAYAGGWTLSGAIAGRALPRLSAGSHTVVVSVSDRAGNPASASSRFQTRALRQRIEGFDWTTALRASLANYRGQAADMDTLARFRAFALELRQELGAPTVSALFEDRRVRPVALPAWLEALGIEGLGPAQKQAICACVTEAPALPPPAYTSYAGRLAAKVGEELRLEDRLGDVLEPEQLARYLSVVGLDPFYGETTRQLVLTSGATLGLARLLTDAWLQCFEIDVSRRHVVQRHARNLVDRVGALAPRSPLLSGPDARRAALARSLALLNLQARVEGELAADVELAPAEQSRALQGSPWVVLLRVKSS